MTLTELVIAALLVWEILEIWHHGSIAASWRAWFEALDHWFISRLAACMLCLAPWVAILLAVPVIIVPSHVIWSWPWFLAWPVGLLTCFMKAIAYGLAVARLANVGNDLTHKWSRTPRDNEFQGAAGEGSNSTIEETGEDGSEPSQPPDRPTFAGDAGEWGLRG